MSLNDDEKTKLMAIAKLRPIIPFKKKGESHLDPVKEFILDEKIISSETIAIPAFIIYMRYVKWCKINSILPKGVSYFFTKFKLHFNSRITSSLRYYYVSPDGFDLSAENLKLVNDEYKTKTSRKATSKRKTK
jgi:hypothetical protein